MNESLIPATNNVCGYIYCGNNIVQVKVVLLRTFGIDNNDVSMNHGLLKIKLPAMELEVKRKDEERWSVNAAVAGDNPVVVDVITGFAQQLKWSGFSSNYEIYNDQFECIKTIDM